MPYSEQDFEEMRYNPVLVKQYFWRVAMGMKRKAMVTGMTVQEHGQFYQPPNFKEVYEHDSRERAWSEVLEACSEIILKDIDLWVRSSIERPKVCKACKIW